MIVRTGLAKGLSVLFIELMVFAREMGLLPEALETCNELYPGITEPQQSVEKSLRSFKRCMI